MKKIGYLVAVVLMSFCSFISPGHCIPLDLSGFSGDGMVSGATVRLEDDFSQQWYVYGNPSYTVASDAGILSFDYTLDLIPDTTYDYFTMEINYQPVLTVMSEGSGTLTYDMSAFQGQPIDLSWVLYWGGDLDAGGSWATISNIDLASSNVNPVPEPSTIMLIGLGVFCLPFYYRKKC